MRLAQGAPRKPKHKRLSSGLLDKKPLFPTACWGRVGALGKAQKKEGGERSGGALVQSTESILLLASPLSLSRQVKNLKCNSGND